jgi:hypothetical protein
MDYSAIRWQKCHRKRDRERQYGPRECHLQCAELSGRWELAVK